MTASTGVITTVAGNGTAGYSGDGGQATSAELYNPAGLALDSAGNIYIADDTNNRIRRVTASAGIITTVAGNGTAGYSGDGGQATSAELYYPSGLALDSAGNIYIADTMNHRIRVVGVNQAAQTITFSNPGILTYGVAPITLTATASSGLAVSYTVTSGPATVSGSTLTIMGTGNVTVQANQTGNASYIAATPVNVSFTVNPAPQTITFPNPGTMTYGVAPITLTATASSGLAVSYTVSSGPATVSGSTLTITGAGTVTVQANQTGDPDYYAATPVSMSFTVTVQPAPAQIFSLTPTYGPIGTLVTITGDSFGVTQGASTVSFNSTVASVVRWSNAQILVNVPTGATSGNVVVTVNGSATPSTQSFNVTVIALPGTGIINTVAGSGTYGYSGDNGQATSAALGVIYSGVAFDAVGNIYIADSGNNRIRKVTASTGIITTVAGNGTSGYSGDGGQATSAMLSGPEGLALDSAGNIYIADTGNNRIRKVTASTGIITTVAGNGASGYSGDGGQATSASLYYPYSVAFDAAGNLYIADEQNHRIRKVTASTGVITTVAGNGTAGYSGDGGQATSAELNFRWGLALDSAGNLYIADCMNNRIRKVTASTGIITTMAGNGTAGYSGDGGQATSAELYYPAGLALDSAGNLYIADDTNNRIRRVTASAGIITTVAGNGTAGYSGDGGQATSAELYYPSGLALDSAGNIYIADTMNHRIRVVGVNQAQTITFSNPGILTYGVAPITLTATASSGLAVSYTVTSGPATVSGSTLTIMGAGNVTVQANQTGNSNYAPAPPVSVNFTVTQAAQTITFPNPGTMTYGVAPITLTGTASSGLAVSYTVSSGPATVSGSTLTITGAGTVTVQANQTGDPDYYAATPVNVSFTVTAEAQAITFPNPGTTYGVAPITLNATASSGLAVSYTVISGPATVSGSTLTITGAGTVTVKAMQAGNSNYAAAPPVSASFTVTVQPAPATIFSLTPTSGPVGTSVTITGSDFGATQGSSMVSFNTVASSVASWNNTQIVVTVPTGATSGSVVVSMNGATTSSSESFTVTSAAPSSTNTITLTNSLGYQSTYSNGVYGGALIVSDFEWNGLRQLHAARNSSLCIRCLRQCDFQHRRAGTHDELHLRRQQQREIHDNPGGLFDHRHYLIYLQQFWWGFDRNRRPRQCHHQYLRRQWKSSLRHLSRPGRQHCVQCDAVRIRFLGRADSDHRSPEPRH